MDDSIKLRKISKSKKDIREQVRPTAGGQNQPSTSRQDPQLQRIERTIHDEEPPMDPKKLIDFTAKHIISLFVPISICMFVVAIVAKQVPYFSGSDVFFVYTPFHTPNADVGTQIWQTLANVAIFLGVVIVMTFFLVLLFKCKCYKFISVWLIVTSFILLFFIAFIFLTEVLRTTFIFFDDITFAILLWNVGNMGLIAIHWKSPMILQHGYLIFNSALVALVFLKYLPKWTCWVLLAALAIWDLIAVLCPRGPLKMMVKMAKERNLPLFPGMAYTTKATFMTTTFKGHTEPSDLKKGQPFISTGPALPPSGSEHLTSETTTYMNYSGRQESMTRHGDSGKPPENDSGAHNKVPTVPIVSDDYAPGINKTQNGPAKPRLAVQLTYPFIHERITSRGEETAINNPRGLRDTLEAREDSGVTLGLGDFIFYSLLIGRAAIDGNALTIVSCYIAILMGVCMTLVALFFGDKPLPALPISIACGIVFYFCTSLVITPFIEKTTEHRLFF